MTALVALAFGAGIGIGLLLIGCGLIGRPVLGARPTRRAGADSSRQWLTVVVALGSGIAVYGVTHWLAGGLLAAAGVAIAPALLSGRSDHEREIARVEAIASWAEMLRDTIAGAAGLEQAIAATGPIAPEPIAEPVARLAARLDFEPLPAALRRFADEVDHPTADFVVAALVTAAEKEARELGPLLGHLADCARDEARMRTRIWIDRAKTRTSVKVIAGSVVAFAAGLLVFSRPYLEPYDDAMGQIVLLAIGGLFLLSLLGMERMARLAVPERFVRPEDDVIAGLGLGAGIGLGLFLIARAVLTRRLPLVAALADLERPRPTVAGLGSAVATGWEQRAGRRSVAVLEGLGLDMGRLRTDLRITDRTVERHAIEKLTAATVGLGTPVLLAVAAGSAGVALPYGLIALSAVCFGAAGFLLPDLLLRDAARARRDALRNALSAYLDLVNVLLAGAAGTETALAAAAAAGDGWAFAELRATLERSRAMRQSPWDAFSALGDELGLTELQELAASVRLAGEQGARIKASLAAKASSLRGQQLARAEAAAHAASERMAVPNVLMFVGFLAFVGYPALVSIVGGI